MISFLIRTLTSSDRTLLHDEAKYGADIDKFYRERFLSPGIKGENVDAAFGFGRR